MNSKLLYILIFAFTLNFLHGQNISFQEKMKEIDSLIYFTHYKQADFKIHELEEILNNQNSNFESLKLKLELKLKKVDLEILKEHYKLALENTINILEEAKKNNLPEQQYKAYLYKALIYEITEKKDKTYENLQSALKIHNYYNLQHLYSTYCIRLSSYHHIFGDQKIAKKYALEAIKFAEKHNHPRDLIDGYLLLTMLLKKEDHTSAIFYGKKAIQEFRARNDHSAVASMYNNISNVYLSMEDELAAKRYNDSAYYYTESHPVSVHITTPIIATRVKLFENAKSLDSAIYYLKLHKTQDSLSRNELELSEIQNIIEKYENHKNKEVIKSQNQQMIFIIALLSLIGIGSLILFHYYRKIQYQNYIISKQVDELTKSVTQKKVLLSELQHRVKNNLQHVISILELQKESVEFNNIDEILRGTQNRIHSMAFLHKKLNFSDYSNDVDFNRYMLELSALVKESYEYDKKNIQMDIECEVEKMSIEKSLPIGLILVELISNSMKHAFHHIQEGVIKIRLKENTHTKEYVFEYSDNGTGYEFENENEKGLGLEIIKGLIQQLDAIINFNSENGFYFRMDFK